MDVLLAVSSTSRMKPEFERIAESFHTRGYHIHFFGQDQLNLDVISLPLLLNYIRDAEQGNIDRVVVLSDIKEYVIAWYRCYNSLAEAYIFCFTGNGLKLELNDFYSQLCNFRDIDQETVRGKIYAYADLRNARTLAAYLLKENRFYYFNDFALFDYAVQKQEEIIHKKYYYKGEEYFFYLEHAKKEEHITLHGKASDAVKGDFIKLLRESYYFSFYGTLALYPSLSYTPEETSRIINNMFDYVSGFDATVRQWVYDRFMSYAGQPELTFPERFYILSLLVMISQKSELMRAMLGMLLEDDQYRRVHYPLLMCTLFYHTVKQVELYDDILLDREKIFLRVVDDYTQDLKLSPPTRGNPRRIAIITSQLLSFRHSPTMWILNYVKNLKKYHPEYEIKIFVEDSLLVSDKKEPLEYGICANIWSSHPSVTSETSQLQYLAGTDVSIYYADHEKDRKEQIREDLQEILRFEPGLIWAISAEFSITRAVLYPYYPVLDMSMGELVSSSKADIYISGYDEASMRAQYGKFKVHDRKIYKFQGGIELPPPQREITRSEYNFTADDFVLVTVGTRLDDELTEPFADMVCSFLSDKPRAKWLIIGRQRPINTAEKYRKVINKQIKIIDFEEDLAALYRICDVYVNPFRKSGGTSAGMAMQESLPVLTLREESDVMLHVGKENCVADIGEYLAEMNRFYEDKAYRQARGEIMKERLEKEFGFEHAIDEMIGFFSMAQDEFVKRNKLSS